MKHIYTTHMKYTYTYENIIYTHNHGSLEGGEEEEWEEVPESVLAGGDGVGREGELLLLVHADPPLVCLVRVRGRGIRGIGGAG